MSSQASVHDPREPLTIRNGSSTFLIALAGLMMANLGPLIMSALEKIGYDTIQSGNILTWALLASAVVGLGSARLAAGNYRRLLAAIGLAIASVAFVLSAVLPNPALVTAFFIAGGAAIGAAISTSGSAIAALRNPNRISAVNGVVNRLLVMVVLAIIPAIGIMQVTVFGALALLSLIGLALAVWLPATPEHAEPVDVTTTMSIAAPRKITIAGIAILILYPLWGTSEDAVWTLAATLGDAVNMSEGTLGLALSAASGTGAFMMLIVMIFGQKIGRAVPLSVALLLGGLLKIWLGFTTDPLTLAWLLVAVNTLYAFVFVLFIATAAGLDARGRWSGPLVGAYLVGSSFAPIIGAWLIDTVGVPMFGTIMGIVSFATIVPIILIARVSMNAERAMVRYGQDA
jgi:MFS family permease